LLFLMAGFALPNSAGGNVANVFAPASRTLNPIGPALRHKMGHAIVNVAVVANRLLQCYGLLLLCHVQQNTRKGLLCQVYYCPNLMARSALQFVVREKGAKKGNLKEQIDDLGSRGVLHPMMQEWAHEVRLLANESAHPDALAAPS